MVVSDHVYLRLMTALISLYHLRHQWDAQPGPSLTILSGMCTSTLGIVHHHRLLYTIISSTPPSSPLYHHHLLYTTIISSTPSSSLVHHHRLHRPLYIAIVSCWAKDDTGGTTSHRACLTRTGHTHEDRTCTSTCVLAFCRRPIRDSAEAGSAAWERVFTRNSRWSVDCMIMSITLNKKWIIIELSHIK